MVDFTAWMLRDRATGRWHNWGGLTEWMPDSPKGGTVWFDKEAADKFASEYVGCDVEVVPVNISTEPSLDIPTEPRLACLDENWQLAISTESEPSLPHFDESWELAKDAKYTGVMPNNPATQFALFDKGVFVRMLTKEEALKACPRMRLFKIPDTYKSL